jgi:endonuclease/exonuclease/phosphatase (EEP) superfamily protein YafD
LDDTAGNGLDGEMTVDGSSGRVQPDLDSAERPEETAPRFRLARQAVRLLVGIAALFLCVPTLLAYLGRLHWGLDVCSHFRVQYLIALAVCAVVLVVVRGRWWLVVAGVGLAINAVEIVPWYFGRTAAPDVATTSVAAGDEATADGASVDEAAAEEAARLTVLSANVWNSNTEHERLLELIAARDPDVVVVLEATEEWTRALEAIAGAYPYSVMHTRPDPFGIAVYSKRPLEGARIVTYGSAGMPTIVATVRIGDEAVTLVATHPVPPRHARNWRLRNEQLDAVAAARAEFGDRLIVAGDFNASPFSPCLRRFVSAMGTADAKLRYASKGYGVKATWPTFNRLLFTPLDHILVSDNLVVTDFRAGPEIGSDHLPVQATIIIGD